MSYDIYFVRRDPGQSFADALDATEDSFDGDPGSLGSAELEQWERIVSRARALLDDVEEFSTETSRDLADGATAIQLSMIADEVTITVPSDRPEQDSVTLMAKVYALARVVEEETGLEGFDPQLQEPVTDPRQRLDAVAPGLATGDGDDEGSRSRPGAGTASPALPQTEPPLPPPETPRRWWEFWKR